MTTGNNVRVTITGEDQASRPLFDTMLEMVSLADGDRPLTLAEITVARQVINQLPGMAFVVDATRHGQTVTGLLAALEAARLHIDDLYRRLNRMEAQAVRDRADKAAARRYLGLDA